MKSTTKARIKYTAKDVAIIAMLTALLFVQEELLTFIHGVQFTVFLLVLYSKKLGFSRTTIIILIHVLLDNLVMNSFSIIFTPFMFMGWMFIPLILCIFFKKTESPLILSGVALVCSFIYCLMYIIPNYIAYEINPIVYLTSDVLFEVIMAAFSFLSVLWLYKPCSKVFDLYLVKDRRKKEVNNSEK